MLAKTNRVTRLQCLARKQDGRERQRTIVLIDQVPPRARGARVRYVITPMYIQYYVSGSRARMPSREHTHSRVSCIYIYIYVYMRPIADDVAMWCNILLKCTNGRDFAAERHDVECQRWRLRARNILLRHGLGMFRPLREIADTCLRT